VTVTVPVPTVIDCRTAAFTETGTEAEIDPNDAVTVALPGANPSTKPDGVTRATTTFELTYVSSLVRFCVEPSLKLPTAINCTALPEFTDGLGGVIVIPVSVAAVIVKLAEAVTLPEVAVILQLPVLTAVARAAALTVQTEEAVEAHVMEFVTF
jgi:hypothetical protein